MDCWQVVAWYHDSRGRWIGSSRWRMSKRQHISKPSPPNSHLVSKPISLILYLCLHADILSYDGHFKRLMTKSHICLIRAYLFFGCVLHEADRSPRAGVVSFGRDRSKHNLQIFRHCPVRWCKKCTDRESGRAAPTSTWQHELVRVTPRSRHLASPSTPKRPLTRTGSCFVFSGIVRSEFEDRDTNGGGRALLTLTADNLSRNCMNSSERD